MSHGRLQHGFDSHMNLARYHIIVVHTTQMLERCTRDCHSTRRRCLAGGTRSPSWDCGRCKMHAAKADIAWVGPKFHRRAQHSSTSQWTVVDGWGLRFCLAVRGTLWKRSYAPLKYTYVFEVGMRCANEKWPNGALLLILLHALNVLHRVDGAPLLCVGAFICPNESFLLPCAPPPTPSRCTQTFAPQ